MLLCERCFEVCKNISERAAHGSGKRRLGALVITKERRATAQVHTVYVVVFGAERDLVVKGLRERGISRAEQRVIEKITPEVKVVVRFWQVNENWEDQFAGDFNYLASKGPQVVFLPEEYRELFQAQQSPNIHISSSFPEALNVLSAIMQKDVVL